MEKRYLHVAVICDHNECFVSSSEADLREQVTQWLIAHSVPVPTDAEWAITFGEDRYIELTTPAVGWISYYISESKL